MVEKILFGLGVAALGMIVVFAGLVILIAFIKLLSGITGESKKKSKPQPVAVSAAKGNGEIPGEVLAAITAALAMSNETASPDVVAAIAGALNVVMGEGNFVVRRIKRIHNAPAWNRAGREEQVYSRF